MPKPRKDDVVDLRAPASDQREDHQRAEDGRGRDADAPQQIPATGWRDVFGRVRLEAREDNLVLIAGGVAFFALLALGPALLALVSIYGLIASPSQVARDFDALAGAMPDEARQLIEEQVTQIARTSGGQLGLQVAFGLVAALWAASSAMKHLAVALSSIYDERETRGFVKLRLTALVTTAAAIVFMVLALVLLAGGPTWIERNVSEPLGTALKVLRWPVLAGLMMVALAAMYRHLPDRDDPKWRWVSWGAVGATAAWVLASGAFALYTSRVGNYERTYGSMAAVIVTMLWLFITALCVLLGAEVNAEIEHQTARDTTEGPERPLGQRDAEMADTVGAPT